MPVPSDWNIKLPLVLCLLSANMSSSFLCQVPLLEQVQTRSKKVKQTRRLATSQTMSEISQAQNFSEFLFFEARPALDLRFRVPEQAASCLLNR
ncbi:hypothetical protein C8R44DRAFT_821895 [Mycena epipterygia]|nr:hypothetical protein C8R44DRAFT_821895 [Mycena epipterygia]